MTSNFKQRHSFISIKRFIFLLAAVLMCGGEMWATDYVFKAGNYYLGINNGSVAVKTQIDLTCIWTASNSSGTPQDELNTNSSNKLALFAYDGTTRYYLNDGIWNHSLTTTTSSSAYPNFWIEDSKLRCHTSWDLYVTYYDDRWCLYRTDYGTYPTIIKNNVTETHTSDPVYSLEAISISPSPLTISELGKTETLTASFASSSPAKKTTTDAYYKATVDGLTYYVNTSKNYTRSTTAPSATETSDNLTISYSWNKSENFNDYTTSFNSNVYSFTYDSEKVITTGNDLEGTVTVTATVKDGSATTNVSQTATANVTLKKMPVFYYSASAGVGTGLSAGGGTVSATAKTGTLDSEKYKIIGTTSDATSVDATVEFKVESTTDHYVFDHWSTMEDGRDNVSTNTTYSCTVSVDNSHSTALSALAINRYAIFKPVSKLTVEVWPHDYGYVYSNESKSATPGWTQNTHTTTIDNTDTETGTSYKVYMFAKPDASHKFKGWSTTKTGTIEYPIDDQTGATSQEISINNTTDVTMYARFVNIYKFEASAKAALKSGTTEEESTVGGTVTATIGTETEHGTESTKEIETSETQASAYTWYVATPNTNYVFDHWTTKLGGTALSGANPYEKITTNTVSGSTVYYNSSSTPVTLYAVFKSLNNPTSWEVTPDQMTLYMKGTKTGTITVTLSPEGCDRDLEFVSANPNVATVSDEGVVTGVAHGTTTVTVKAYIRNTSSERVVGFTQEISVTVEDQIPTPVITWAESTTDASKATITLTKGDGTPDEAKIYYTTDGTDPTSSSTEYTGTFDVGDNTTIKAIAITPTADGWRDSEIATLTLVLKEAEKPVITFSKNSAGKVEVTITSPDEGVTIYYTTDGTDPKTSSTKQTYTSPFVPTLSGTDNTTTIKAYATHPGWKESQVATADYIAGSGIYGTSVILNDLEDHNWTYYKGVDTTVDGGNYNTNYKGKMYSPDPRNVKITYEGNGGEVSIDEDETKFIYYQTLEQSNNKYLYTTIANPFSKRPVGKGDNKWRGFDKWEVVSISKGSLKSADGSTTYVVGSQIPAETEIQCVPADGYTENCISIEVVVKAVWVQAYRYTSASSTMSGDSYEKNFLVLTSDNSDNVSNKNCTIMMVEPDGSGDYRSKSFSGSITVPSGGITKIEYTKWTVTSISPSGKSLYIGRGVTTSESPSVVASNLTNTVNQLFKIESGTYSTFTNYTADPSTITKQWIVFGNDYDRATQTNTNLKFTSTFNVGSSRNLPTKAGEHMCSMWSKSGQFMTNISVNDASADYCYYLSIQNTYNYGHRSFELQGGEWVSFAGGIDYNDTDDEALTFKMKGGTVKGCIYGAASWAQSNGVRRFVILGGTVKGWIAGGANGTSSSEGTLAGSTYVYVGGNAKVDSEGNKSVYNHGTGGNVFGAGCGYNSSSTSGSVSLGTNVVIADDAYVEHGVYGGGSFGYCNTSKTANVYVTGGHVAGEKGGIASGGSSYNSNLSGGVFGGACQNKGGNANIYMTGGIVEGGLYGGSNNSGTLSGFTNILITGGQVGTSVTSTANVHGGGYGADTKVSGNVDVTLGTRTGSSNFSYTTSGSAVIYGDVYGGSALGKTNGTSANTTYHTNVTLNGGTIHGSLYGGALGDASTAAYVYAPVTVKVYGGSVKKTSAAGSGGVYGANNVKGAPQKSVTVDIWGTDPATSADEYALYAVYGGGNQSAYKYTGYPIVTVHNCDNSIEYVYGGGNAADVSSTDVTIWGGNVIGNVFGGGNGSGADNPGANVDGKAAVKINGGTIISVYGGSNEKGTIGGGTSVVVNQQKEEGASDVCYMLADSVFGGGNKAAYTGNTDVQILNGQVKNVFGGANKAVVTGNTSVKIGDTDTSHKVTILGNVFGGGNEADVSGNTVLTVEDCNTSIAGDVYGGGNLADVTNANVTIYGGTIGNVFGGGRGSLEPTPDGTGADVNGNATTNVYGGQFGGIFGAGNIKSNISGTAKLYVSDETYSDHACCDFGGADEIYGAGNKAEIDGSIDFSLGCIKNKIKELYGGAKDANLGTTEKHCDINLNIISGTFGKIFGGNNLGGTIIGTITVNIDETGCDSIVIDELYGGGNLAAYAGDPTLNVKSCTRIGKIFGGGLGNGATVTGNPAVNVELGKGLYSADHKSRTGYEIGIIGTVFGGGNEADVTGNTAVKIATVDGKDAVITGNVYGGGNNASVTGSTDVQIGKKK